jgi:hypothetical protein
MKTFIIDAKILDPEEVYINYHIQINTEEQALDFFNANYTVIEIIKVGCVE